MPRKTQQNDITSPILLEQVSVENQNLKKEFINYLYSVDRSPKTIIGYINDIDIFMVWNLENNNNKFFVDLTKKDFVRYQGWIMANNKNSPSRVRRLKATLSSLSNFIENILDDVYPNFRNIVKKVENPVNQAVREKTVLTNEQVELLLKTLVERKQFQKACAFAVCCASGVRKTEITRFKVDYFKEENIIYGAFYKTPEKMKTKGRSSRGKMLDKFILVSQFKPYFDLWMEQRKELGIDNEYLFVTRNKNGDWQQICPETFNSWALTFSKILGVDFYWHSLRHYFTTSLARANIPDSVIQEIIGWSSLDMVKIYKDIDASENIGKFFDENGAKDVKQGKLSDL